MEFPVLIKNNKNVVRVVGGLMLPPLGVVEVSKSQYLANKDKIELDVDVGGISVLSGAKAQKAKEEIKKEEEAKKASSVSYDPELIEKFNNGEIHWQHVVKQIDACAQNEEAINHYYNEALRLGIKENGIVMKAIKSIILANNS